MDFSTRTINLKIKHFDYSGDLRTIDKTLIIYPNMDYKAINRELFNVCEASPEKQVLKIRNGQNVLIPISFLIENEEPYYVIDVATISCFSELHSINRYNSVNQLFLGVNTTSLLQDAYVDSVCNKVKTLESRIAQTELLMPQLEWRKQSYMEDTVSALLNKVQFLNRRFDELYPKYKAGTLGRDLSP
ncbi:uncharacterized protein [Euwallacea fornicatus]|uniref:uncharacterized protein isoform X1 n=1 Tax=Euwallacea fornicatus TaxID=995702 RepID=UPI00338E57C2